MSARVVLTGAPHDLAEALRTMRTEVPLIVTCDPTLLAAALHQVREHGHQVVEDMRLRHKVLLELNPVDHRRLGLLAAADESDVLATARRAIHAQLDELIATPRCGGRCETCSQPR